jgi:hypothetical protein
MPFAAHLQMIYLQDLLICIAQLSLSLGRQLIFISAASFEFQRDSFIKSAKQPLSFAARGRGAAFRVTRTAGADWGMQGRERPPKQFAACGFVSQMEIPAARAIFCVPAANTGRVQFPVGIK